jgi:spore photoproduct lyase
MADLLRSCKNCNHDKNAPSGICTVRKASDSLDIRCVGKWAKNKYYYIGNYLKIFTTAMRKKWKLYYIDLFAGCGKCKVRETEEEIDGSALIALNLNNPFDKYIFVDLNQDALSSLKKRAKDSPLSNRMDFKEGDCNEKVLEILKEIPQQGTLCLAVIDPTGLQIKFETIRKLTRGRRVDLIITFPEGMAIKRNIDQFLKHEESPLDGFMGDRKWRDLYKAELATSSLEDRRRRFIDLYRENLKKISYGEIKSGEEILIRSSQKRLPLYYLLFASKHQLGHTFWSSIGDIAPDGQTKFKFGNPHTIASLKKDHMPILKIRYKNYRCLNGEKQTLVEQVNDGSIIIRFDKTAYPQSSSDIVCPHFLELKWAYGCPFDCAWCYLKGTFRFRPERLKPTFKPLEKVKLHVESFLEQVETPEILNSGEIADSLMGEGDKYPFSKFIIPLFQKQKRHKVLFVTKSANIKHLLEIHEPQQAVISFSLNADAVSQKWEGRAPSVMTRIEAARKLHEHGYEVRARIDPMVPIEDWDKHYRSLIDAIFDNFMPERITLGSLRGLQSTINGVKDKSWTAYLKETSHWGKKIDFKTRYEMYQTVSRYLRDQYNFSGVALCKETVAMWEELKMDWKQVRCNCVW